jgi:hypothetical protein
MQNTLTQSVQLGPPIHLSFNEFEEGHVPRRLPIAVRDRYGRSHRREVMVNALREAFEVCQRTRPHRIQPGLQRCGGSFSGHLRKVFCECGHLRDNRIVLLHPRQWLLLFSRTITGATEQQIRELPGCQGGPGRRRWRGLGCRLTHRLASA